MTEQVWFVTGASKGLGAAIAKELLAQGYKVVAAARNTGQAKNVLGDSSNLQVVELDLTDGGRIERAVQKALEVFGRIDVLVNNAGYGLLGYFEELSEKAIRLQMETNVFGTMALTRAVLPTMRKQGFGWIINFSSTSGIKAVEGGSVYSASKFAVEGWTEGLAIELKPFGINCMIVEPGAFRTDFFNEKTSFAFSDLEISEYDGQRAALHEHFVAWDGKQPGDPSRLGKAMLTAMHSENPPLRLLCGKFAAESIDQYMKKRRDEFETWKAVSVATDFDC